MQLLDGFSVMWEVGIKVEEIDGFFLWRCLKKILYSVFQWYKMAHGTILKNELLPYTEVDGY